LIDLTSALPEEDPRRVTSYSSFVLELACLLHDLGHGPLSHQFDLCVEERFSGDKKLLLDHEERGVRLAWFVLDDCWRQSPLWRTTFPNGVRDLHNHVRALVLGKPSTELPACLAHAVHASSTRELDLDRLDYLPRDADILLGLQDRQSGPARRAKLAQKARSARSARSARLACMAHRAIDESRLSANFRCLHFESQATRELLALRVRLYRDYYSHTERHLHIVNRAVCRLISPWMAKLLRLRTRRDAILYVLKFREKVLMELCVEEGLMMEV
jgi:hypothetical protein